ncbi:MAG TPA: nucleotide exchange factor GrpE [Chthoniobacteraceae bacterium]|nr:nucleotide exchange factor GrpE [Chthoniobacteraceae bacterium]
MKALADEAEKQVDDHQNRKSAATGAAPLGFLQMLRPLVLGLEALSRATVENTMVLSRLEAASSKDDVLPKVVSEIQEKFQNKNEINQQLFDALHQELKGYKDGFILEVLQKPLVRDLITLYDDLAEIHRQMNAFVDSVKSDSQAGPALAPYVVNAKNSRTNLDHVMQFLLEIMARMEVDRLEPGTGKLNKTTQRAVSVELADNESDDGDIARSLKPGFMWRQRIVRPEEVIIKKWKEGFLVAIGGDKEGNEVQPGITDANLGT